MTSKLASASFCLQDKWVLYSNVASCSSSLCCAESNKLTSAFLESRQHKIKTETPAALRLQGDWCVCGCGCVRACVRATPAPATNVFIIHTFSAVNRCVWQWSRLSVYSWEVTKDESSSIRKTKASSGAENELHTHSTCTCLCVCRANYHLSKDNSGTSRRWCLRWFVIISDRWINLSFYEFQDAADVASQGSQEKRTDDKYTVCSLRLTAVFPRGHQCARTVSQMSRGHIRL